MSKRGRILRTAAAEPGLVAVDHQNYPFPTGPVWKSAAPPAVGMAVDVEFAADGSVAGLTPVPQDQVTREQAEAVMLAARQKGGALASAAVARFGWPFLAAIALLIVGWFFLSAVSVSALFGKVSFTFWQVLGFLNSDSAWEAAMQGQSGPGAGLYGFLAIVALAGPFVRFFWKDARASLGGVLPLFFMLLVGLMVHSSLHSALGGTAQGPLAQVQQQAQDEIMSAIHIGFGAWLSLLVCVYLAVVALRQFLASRTAVPAPRPRSTSAPA